jgi:hypothetical protein
VGETEGETQYDPKTQTFHWRMPLIDSSTNGSGALEFKVPQAKSNAAFFPVHVQFEADHILGRIKLLQVMDEQEKAVEYLEERQLTTAQYDIE